MPDTLPDHLLRQPYITPGPGGPAPLTVLFSLLSRSDTAADPSANALQPNPNLSFEHWGEYWRKVHGPRFVHTEEPGDHSLERLLRYEQLHRFAPGPSSYNAPPYQFPVDAHGKLWPTIVGHVPPYVRPAWDGAAYLHFARLEDMAVVFGNDRVQLKIAPEDRAIFRNIAPIPARQYIVVPSASGNDPITLVKLHVRAHHTTRAAFQAWWLREHAPVVAGHTGGLVRRYVQLHSLGPTAPGEPFFHPDACHIDGVSLWNFASVDDLEDFLRSEDYQVITRHEQRMIDTCAGEWWTSIGMMIVNRIGAERITEVDTPAPSDG